MSNNLDLMRGWESKANKPYRAFLDWLLLRHYETKKDKRDGYRITFWLSDADYEELHKISPSFKSMCR